MSGKEIIKRKFTTVSGKEFHVSYCKITGKSPGPTLACIAGQHGMEHSGPNILTQIIEEINPDSFDGTLYLCPCANPLALEQDYEIYPENEDLSKLKDYYYSIFRHNYCIYGLGREDGIQTMYNMNRLWNRKEIIGVAGEITSWLWSDICINADVTIDFHSLQAEKPLIFNAAPQANIIAKYFGIEAISMYCPNPDAYNIHNLMYQSNGPGRYGFCVEFSIQHGLKESEYSVGIKGIYNIMKAMGMMSGEIIHSRPVWILPQGGQKLIRTKAAGHIRYFFNEYDQIQSGDKLYEIRDIQTLELLDEGFSPLCGVMGFKSHRPVTVQGDVACRVSEVELAAPAGVSLKKLGKEFFKNTNNMSTANILINETIAV
ncbi:MAG: succinylglutamate desuccinylase/aspartoacylase family protein [Victivallaceae bacterium]